MPYVISYQVLMERQTYKNIHKVYREVSFRLFNYADRQANTTSQ